MTFPNRPVSLWALAAAALLSLAIFACNLASEDGHTFLRIKTDAAWSAYDTLEITWKDTVSGDSGTLYYGKPADLGADEKLPAEGYHGQKIVITVKGFIAHKLTYQEIRNFDGANPAATEHIVIAIKPIPVDSPKVIDTTVIIPPVIIKGKPNPPRLSPILAEPTISIHDSESFLASAVLDSGSLKAYAWDYDGDGKFEDSLPVAGKTARISGGFVYRTPGIFKVTLKAVSDADSVGISQVSVTVLRDEPIAYAGGDTTVYPNAVVRLHGRGKDGMGRIVRTEWKIGSGNFTEAPGDTSLTAPSVPQDLQAVFRVTDDDTLAESDTMTIHIISANESNLTGIVFSKGNLAPQFNPVVFAYTDTVPYDLTTLTVTPSGNGVITVNDAVVSSGQASGPLDIRPGANSVVIVAKLAGAAAKTYTVNVYRPSPSANVNLKSLRVRAGGLDTSVAPNASEYRFNTATAIDTALISLSLEDTLSSLSVKSPAIPAGTGTWKLPLGIGANTLPVEVTSQNGLAKTYTLIVTRAAPVDTATSHLTGLAVSKGVLSPAFNPAVQSYADTVTSDVGSVTVTPTGNGSITVNGVAVVSGQASQPFSIAPGAAIVIPIKVQYGSAPEKAYTITVQRQAGLSANADLSSLLLGPGTLDTAFSAGDTVYTAKFGYTDSNAIVTAALADTSARFTITPASPVPLSIGVTKVSVQVTAKNGTKKTYTVTVTRAAASSNADLDTIAVAPGQLDSAFKASDTVYQVSVANSVLTSTVTARAADSTAKVVLSRVSPFNLAVGANPLAITVTAQNGVKKTYSVTIIRSASANADLSLLQVSPGTWNKVFTPSDTIYSVAVTNATGTTNVTAVLADTTARLTITPSASPGLNVGPNLVTVAVTAQNGTKKTYSITVTRAGASNANLAGMSLTSQGTGTVPLRLFPAFSTLTTGYLASPSNSGTIVRVTPTATHSGATIKVNNATVASGTQSGNITLLTTGPTTLSVEVTAEDGTTKKTYSVSIARPIDVGYAVGDLGFILKTYDAGASWTTLRTPEFNGLLSASFLNVDTGYTVGCCGDIFRTNDGGVTWAKQTNPITNHFYATRFIDTKTGYAVGESGSIIKTVDGGTVWTPQVSNFTFPLYAAYFINTGTGYIVGDYGKILKTVDGGANWDPQTSGTTVNYLHSVHFTDANTGYAAGNAGFVTKTVNGGGLWTPQSTGTSDYLSSIYFTSASTGFAVGEGGTILKTVDAGVNWVPKSSGTSGYLSSVIFLDANTGLAGGQSGALLRTTDAGESWNPITSGVSYNVNSICFPAR